MFIGRAETVHLRVASMLELSDGHPDALIRLARSNTAEVRLTRGTLLTLGNSKLHLLHLVSETHCAHWTDTNFILRQSKH